MSISSFVLMIHHLASLTGSFCLLTIHLDGPVFYLDIQSDCKHINFHKKGKCCNTELESPFCVYHLNTYIHYLQAIFILSVFISKVFNLVNFLCIHYIYLSEAAKKCFLSGPATKALPPSPLELWWPLFWGEFFFELQKKYFFLSGRATKKTFFAASLHLY